MVLSGRQGVKLIHQLRDEACLFLFLQSQSLSRVRSIDRIFPSTFTRPFFESLFSDGKRHNGEH